MQIEVDMVVLIHTAPAQGLVKNNVNKYIYMYIYIRKSVHRTQIPSPKCHSEKGYICTCDRYSMKLLLSLIWPTHGLLYET